DGGWQHGDLHRGPAGTGRGEILPIEAVIGGEIALDVREEDGDVHQVFPPRPGIFEHGAHVVEDGPALRLDVVALDRAVRREPDTGNLARAALAGTDPGQEEQVADTSGMRVRPDRLRCARGLELVRAHSFTQTFFASVKNRSASIPPSRPTPDSFTPPNGVRRSRSIQQLTQTIPLCSWAATRCARDRSRVQSEAARP